MPPERNEEDLEALGLSSQACEILRRVNITTKSKLVYHWRKGNMKFMWDLTLTDTHLIKAIIGDTLEKVAEEQMETGKSLGFQSADDEQSDIGFIEIHDHELKLSEVEKSQEDDLSVFGLATRTVNHLHNAGIRKVSLLKSLGLRDILNIQGISIEELWEIERLLAELRGERIGKIAIGEPRLITDMQLHLTGLHELQLGEEIEERLKKAYIFTIQDLVDCIEGELQSILQVGQQIGKAIRDIELVKDKLNRYLSSLLTNMADDQNQAFGDSSQNDHGEVAGTLEHDINNEEHNNLKIALKAVDGEESYFSTREGKLIDTHLYELGISKNDHAGQKQVIVYLNEIPLEVLGLSSMACNRLRIGRIMSLGELLDSTWEKLASIWYMGEKTLNEIDTKISTYLSSHPTITGGPIEVGAIADPSLLAQLQNANVSLDRVSIDVLGLLPGTKAALRMSKITTVQQLCRSTHVALHDIEELSLVEIREIIGVLNFFLTDTIAIIEEVSRLYELAGQLCEMFKSRALFDDISLPEKANEHLSYVIDSPIETLADLRQAVSVYYSKAAPDYLEQPHSKEPDMRASIRWISEALKFKNIDDELKYLINTFDPRQQLIFSSRYMGEGKRTLEEIGKRLGITRERVRQIEAKALQKLERRATKAPLLHLRASIALLRRLGEEATLELWKKEMLSFELLPEESSFDLLVAVYRATNGFKKALSEEATELLPRASFSRRLLSLQKDVLRVARKLNRNSGAVRAASLSGEKLSATEVTQILSSANFFEILPGWWTRPVGKYVPARVAEKVIWYCGLVSPAIIRHALRRHLRRSQCPTPPSEVIVKALQQRGSFTIVDGLLHLSNTSLKEPTLTGAESVFLKMVRTEGPVVSFESIHANVVGQGLSGASAVQLVSFSPLVQKIAVGLYTLLGTKYDAADIEEARSRLTRMPAMSIIRPCSNGIMEFETNVSNWLVYGGVLGAGPAASMIGEWAIIDKDVKKGKLTVAGYLIRGLSRIAADLSLVAGDRIRIDFNTWTREAKITKVVNHEESNQP